MALGLRVLNLSVSHPHEIYGGRFQVRRDAFLTLATNAALLITQLVAAAVLAQSLGPAGRGSLATVTVWATLALTAGLLGTTDALAFFTARSSVLRRATTGAVLGHSWALVALSIILLTAWALASDSSPQGWSTLAVAAAYVAGRVGLELVISILRGVQSFGRFNAARLTAGALPAAFFVPMAAVDVLTVNTALAVYALGSISAILVGLDPLAVLLTRPRPPLRRRAAMAFASYSGRNLIATIATTLNRSADLLALTITASAADVGTYAVAVAYAAPLTVVGAAAGIVVLPAIQSAATAQRRRALIQRASLSIAVLVLVGSFVAILLAGPVIPAVFGVEFSSAVRVSQILTIGMSVASLTLFADGVLRGLGRPGAITAGRGIGAAITLGLIVTWAGSDLDQAAVATTCGFTAAALIELLAIGTTIHKAHRTRRSHRSESPLHTRSE